MGLFSALGSIGGGIVSGLFGQSEAKTNAKMQEKFAKKGIRWKVADAKAAGIHPLAALGASSTFTPVTSGFGDSVGAGVAAAGAAIDEANKETARGKQKSQVFELEKSRVASEIQVNSAQAKLLETQALNIANQARNKALGARGAVTPIPAPENIRGPLGGWQTGATTKTQDIEDHYGGAAGEIYGLMRLLKDTYTHSTPNVKWGISKRGKKPHRSKRW